MNRLIELVFRRLPLRVPECKLPYRLYPDFGDLASVGVLTQGEGELKCPVAVTSHKPTCAELKLHPVDRLVKLVSTCLHKFRRYCAFSTKVEIVWSDEVHLSLLR